MACTHADTCPLFPMLYNNLAGWRSAYCDSDAEWLQCARYQKSLGGEPMPLALLPNGKIVGWLADREERENEAESENESGSEPVVETPQPAVAARVATSDGTRLSWWRRLLAVFSGGESR